MNRQLSIGVGECRTEVSLYVVAIHVWSVTSKIYPQLPARLLCVVNQHAYILQQLYVVICDRV